MASSLRRRVRVNVNGKAFVVEVGDLGTSPITVSVNGRPYLVNIETDDLEIVPGDTSVTTLESIRRATSSPEKAPSPPGPAGPLVGQVKAPMPGNILDIKVRAGEQVRFRQQLCSLEAMKMKNAIRSPRDGVIASVEVSEGQTVAHGDVLFTFE
ncbi:MAG: biotin/lipoyl-containing protein [Anaerolineae bacterium]